MKTGVFSIEGIKAREIDLPAVFGTDVRPELISRAVLHEASLRLQPKGAFKLAGLQTTAAMRGRKESYRAIKNRGISRLPREKLPKGRFGRVRIVPFAVGGRRAHPPNPEEVLVEQMNRKEYEKALKSAIAATARADLVKARGHKFDGNAPIVVDDAFESLAKTKDVQAFFEKIGLGSEITRAANGSKRKSGVRKTRSGGTKRPKSMLVVVKEGAKVLKAARNIPGVDVCTLKGLKAELLAPGCVPGRLTVWSEGAIKELANWKLVM